MKEKLQKRNSTVEGLRILSMFLIIMFHFCGRGLGLFDIDSYSAVNLGGQMIMLYSNSSCTH